MSNCTKCHDLGKQVSKAKCLGCHTEISDLINQNKGYHSNKNVASKNCWNCHSDHFGRNFKIIKFDEDKFNHNDAGFELKESHKNLECGKCHKPEFITDKKLKRKKKTFLGLKVKCSNCHEDFHQNSLGDNCLKCHNENKFKPAVNFLHSNTKFDLTGKHKNVGCEQCHAKETKNNKLFQKFANVEFASCKSCHNDFHQGKFGNDCKKCHNTNSFNDVNIGNKFDHSKTDFPLVGRHQNVKCENCHKENLTKKLKFSKCYECHEDYHKGEFIKNNIQTDCKVCHSEAGFSPSLFTTEMHNKTEFKLANSHLATPCYSCHYKNDNWHFIITGSKCITCHSNVHGDEISDIYFDKNKCEFCHTTISWDSIEFDHSTTEFELNGKHKTATCRDCHFKTDENNNVKQRFIELETNCTECHNDIHQGQFVINEKVLCENCHTSENWKPVLFDHAKTNFSLEGAHKNVSCNKCHKQVTKNDIAFINYKLKDFRCVDCHS